jgi:hypothetical protein
MLSRVIKMLRVAVVAPLLLSAGFVGATPPENGWWWNPAESGRGFAIEVQNGSMLLAGFMYDNAGTPVWYVSGPAPMTSDVLYQGKWISYANGQTLNGQYKSAVVTNDAVGSVVINFTSTTTATLQLPNGTVMPLVRFGFGPQQPGPVSATCTSANINLDKYNRITVGMTMAQVNQTLGCTYLPGSTHRTTTYVINSWTAYDNGIKGILIYFDKTNSVVTAQGGSVFKSSSGF